MERWQINRAGIINFWYYGDEDFIFEKGRLLLRGSNGSGKSVTMQSLIPLLFDGNKSPERLDTFGSKARKMDSYLLSEGLGLEERTAYLFLEFYKPESGRYKTIGLGMRAKKNTPINTWYFIVNDNRRLGAKYDLSLYKDIGDKIPLTKRELENRIGQGGSVFERQKDYKAAVNDHLFGYDDLTDFDELITLLIQIRSPKLSKEFKPTTMYEILQNSLYTLTEEDLRPMSESIESMDGVKEKIDNLKHSKRALDKVDAAFDRYNTYILADKAKSYKDHYSQQKSLLSKLDKCEKNLNLKLIEEEELLNRIKDLQVEEEVLNDKDRQLRDHDLSRLSEDKLQVEGLLHQGQVDLERKKLELSKLEDEERTLIDQEKTIRGHIEGLEDDFKTLYETLAEKASGPKYDEADFLISSHERLDGPFDFGHHKRDLSQYIRRVKEGLEAVRAYDRVRNLYDQALENKETSQNAFEKQERKVKDYDKQFASIKEELAEDLINWNNSNQVLRYTSQQMSSIVERMLLFGETYQLEECKHLINQGYFDYSGQLSKKRGLVEAKKETLLSEVTGLKEEIKVLEAMKDVEPVRSQAAIENRQVLDQLNIPYVPLYQALDFMQDLDDSMKNLLEEALVGLNMIDALVVDPKYRDQVLSLASSDTYLFSKPNLLSHNLSNYLRVDKKTEVNQTLVEDVLHSIFIDDSNDIFINDQGVFANGILVGKTSGSYESKYISYASRKRHKQGAIAELEVAISSILDQVKVVDLELAGLIQEEKILEDEYKQMPSTGDMELAYTDLNMEKQTEASKKIAYEEALAKLGHLGQDLREVEKVRSEKTHKIYMDLTEAVYKEALEDLDDYKDLVNNLVQVDISYWHFKDKIISLKERLEGLVLKLDDVRYEINRYERDTYKNQMKLETLKEQLQQEDYKSYEETFNQVKTSLTRVAKDLSQARDMKTTCKIDISSLSRDLEDYQKSHESIQTRVDLYEWALRQEWDLAYVDQSLVSDDILMIANHIIKTYGPILEEDKTLNDIRANFQTKLREEQGGLIDYNMKTVYLFKDIPFDLDHHVRDQIERLDINASLHGRSINFKELMAHINDQIKMQQNILDEKDRELFEEILINSIRGKITAKIYHSEKWVKKIDQLMQDMNTSSSLKLSIRWTTKTAQSEDQLSTRELVEILKRDPGLITDRQRAAMIKHFKSKIQESKNRMETEDHRSFLAIIKEVLDYRKWFEFKLSFVKSGESKKELTNNAFFTFSGGEKAMAMYVPLFSAVYAKYQSGAKDCPTVISLDEAFAGVDENNIKDMFKLLEDLKLSFIANSQVLFGDYETIPQLAIYELIRPENVTFVTLIRYLWNGKIRKLVTE